MTRRSSQSLPHASRELSLLSRRVLRLTLSVACPALAFLVSASAQAPTRRATNIAALTSYPGFYHLRPILLVGKVEQQQSGQLRVNDGSGSLRLVTEGNAPEGVDEIRGEFWDLGRMNPDDPRLAAYDLRRMFQADPDGAWPQPGAVTAIIASAITPVGATAAASIRAIVLDPSRYLAQKVTITGQYEGRNLMGDLPAAPAQSRWDFVLRAADAAIWVVNIQPKGKDGGKDFQLGLDRRIDTGRWLQVSGTVQRSRGLMWIDARAGKLAAVKPPTDTPADNHEAPVVVPAAPPPEVVFSAPAEDETDVPATTNVRIQFSRNLDPATLRGRVRAAYMPPPGTGPGGQAVEFTTRYSAPTRVLELRFTNPLERFRTVSIQLLDGILGTDKQPLKPWTLTFSLGGS